MVLLVYLMEKTASQMQKERIQEIEAKANVLLEQCNVVTLSSINEKGYPRTCVVTKLKDNGWKELYFETSKRSQYHGKTTHFENNNKASVCYFKNGDSVTLIGTVAIIDNLDVKEQFAGACDSRFFKAGVLDPKHRLLHFVTIEATFWIEGKFRTCYY